MTENEAGSKIHRAKSASRAWARVALCALASLALPGCSSSMQRMTEWPDVDRMTAVLEQVFGCSWGEGYGDLYCVNADSAGKMDLSNSRDAIVIVHFAADAKAEDFADFRKEISGYKVHDLEVDLNRVDESKAVALLTGAFGFEAETAQRLVSTPHAQAASGPFRARNAQEGRYRMLYIR